jgi:hypothetical protein
MFFVINSLLSKSTLTLIAKVRSVKTRLRKVAALGLLAFFALWVAVELLDPDGTPGSWLLLKLFHPGPRYFELAVDLEVEGQPVSIVRVIECKPKFAYSDMSGGFGYSIGWYPSRYLISEELKDGAGIMVVVPRACSLDAPPSPDFIPLILWTQDAANPQILEAYYDNNRLSGGGLRVKLIRFELVQNSEPSATPPQDFADLLNVFTKDPSPSGPRSQFVALAALSLPRGQRPDELAGLSPDSHGLRVLPQPVTAPGKDISDLIAAAIGRLSGGYHPDLPPDVAERRRRLNTRLTELHAFRPTAEQQLEFTNTPIGVVYFVRSDLSWCGQTRQRCIAADGEVTIISDNRIQHYLVRDEEVFLEFESYLTLIRPH